MQIAIVSPYATVAPHYETELELAQRHLDAGDQIDWLACLGGLSNCDFNATHADSTCHDCRLRREHGLSLLSERIQPVALCGHDKPPVDLSALQSVDELKALVVDGFDIGYAVLSSLVSLVRDPNPDLGQHSHLLRSLFSAAYSTFRQVEGYLASKPVDRVYIFNGRFAAMRAVVRACQQAKVDCQIHERGATIEQYELYANHLPHEIDQIQALIEQAWNQASNHQHKVEVAREWFENRRQGIEKNWTSFTKDQTRSRLPGDWRSNRRNVVLFSSSDDEFVAIGDQWRHELYRDQLTGVRELCQSLRERSPDVHITLRMHPNLIHVENSTKEAMLGLQFPNLTIVAPDEPVDTYGLLDAADVVATFGSSIGIEAVYWKRPSVLLGPCLYRGLGGTEQPQSHEQVLDCLTEPLVPGDPTGALKYGFWFNTHGIPFRYFAPESWYHGRFRGEVVYAKPQPKTPNWIRPLEGLRRRLRIS